mmetsp:Transcript_53503/g.68676  ORF Transcript_53503/g.68676 Transcript_53503/m.68676 type:complete len:595 (-) Transcript_53503:140-1924(-)
MVKKKGKSGRQTFQQKYKIEKRVKEHHRRLKKDANRKSKAGIKSIVKKQKDPGIPNDCPFKEELLTQIAQAKTNLEERKELQKEARKEARSKALAERRGLASSLTEGVSKNASLLGLTEASMTRGEVFTAAAASIENEESENKSSSSSGDEGQKSRRAYLRELRKTVGQADVILEVLDARDPMGSRALAIEAMIASNSKKKLVLVLNKVDLVPKEVAKGWLAVLRRSYPTVAFKASTQERTGRGVSGSSAEDMLGENILTKSSSVGGEALMSLLKNYCRTEEGAKTSIMVGVIGYPNTGKSSLINSLKCSNVVGTSAVAGFTKSMAEVILDKSIRLLDSPGIVFDDTDTNATALRNCVAPEELKDPEGAIGEMLKRCAPEQLMALYALPAFKKGDSDTFLSLVARRLGKMKKGGVPDKASSAIAVLRDWNSGRVPYYAKPPDDTSHLIKGSAMIVSKLGEKFNPENMMEGDAEVLEETCEHDPFSCVAFESGPAGTGSMGNEEEEEDNEEEDDDEEEEEDEEAPALVAAPPQKKSSKRSADSSSSNNVSSELATSSADSRRSQKENLKKMKKAKRRASQQTEGEEESYNFNEHY